MPTPSFLDPNEIRNDRDRPHLADLPPVPETLVFVLGLHRSGTTFLYQLLSDYFPLATTQLYHITHYRRLLHARAEGLEETYRQELADYLQALGLATRGTDGIAVHPGGLEEYAFILRKFSPKWGYAPESAELLDEVLRKLMAVQPESRGLLVKNPYDLGAIDALAARYPQAKFVLIRRDPLRVLDSQLRAGMRYRKHPEYLNLLMAGTPFWREFLPLWRFSNVLIPDGLYERYILGLLTRDIGRELERHYRALPNVPSDRYVEVSYDELMHDPQPALDRIQTLIQLPFKQRVQAIAAAPREKALPTSILHLAGSFRESLSALPDSRLHGS